MALLRFLRDAVLFRLLQQYPGHVTHDGDHAAKLNAFLSLSLSLFVTLYSSGRIDTAPTLRSARGAKATYRGVIRVVRKGDIPSRESPGTSYRAQTAEPRVKTPFMILSYITPHCCRRHTRSTGVPSAVERKKNRHKRTSALRSSVMMISERASETEKVAGKACALGVSIYVVL